MAGSILVRDAIARISNLLQDASPQFTRWSEREIVDWLNDAQLAISKFLPSSASRVDSIKLRQGTLQSIEVIAAADCLPGDGSAPPPTIRGLQVLDVLCNMGAAGTTPGRAIRLVSDGREALDTQIPDWHASTGSTVLNFFFDLKTPRHFHVYPGVTGSVWARVSYAAQPQIIVSDADAGFERYASDGFDDTTLSVGDEHLDDLVNYACARARMKNSQFGSNSADAQAFTTMFLNSLNGLVFARTGNNPNLKRLPFAPEPVGRAG